MKNTITIKKILMGILAILVISLISLGIFLYIRLNHSQNFHVVEPGVVYRSAQPDAKFIKHLWDEYGIKSIINLRNLNDNILYKEEETISKKLGIKLINFPISIPKGLNENEIIKLITLLKETPKPLLIHCKSGADRAGLASYLYLYFISKDQKANADKQLSIFYGHIPYFKTRKIDDALEISKNIKLNYIPALSETQK
ncbi:dual specificity protein phosphatase family protein [Candidatus Liberibacter americanus]|uniref:Protein tyrosine/serine phosphatase n=1 Tax=Candidatus Liberibacter americanus str. Sao Paulo TaxID=1261131 RepID=U6B497_9HYPH|nr:dual specificity protein phosphatase family protein [Candidatus Liberibacter americanus]AHA27889.1 Protein tyrosine/serine phosphatase [Candidatus Liberibacter americanus str. Sao Paulo]EMS36114.1 hypothetical protein G653_03341 [Candidatus Liberibacter americanus PW_SP]